MKTNKTKIKSREKSYNLIEYKRLLERTGNIIRIISPSDNIGV